MAAEASTRGRSLSATDATPGGFMPVRRFHEGGATDDRDSLLLIVVICRNSTSSAKNSKSVSLSWEGAAENLRMVKARYTGVDRSKRPFSITAEEAEQANPNSPIIELIQPKADIVMENGMIAVTAELEITTAPRNT